jgi:membrane-bound ClpP family serine protease
VINSAAFSLLENGNRKSSNQFKFPDVINTTEMILAQQKHRAEQKERQAEFAQERAKKAAELEAKRLEEKKVFDEALETEEKRIADYRKESKIAPLSERDLHSYAFENVARQNAQIAA